MAKPVGTKYAESREEWAVIRNDYVFCGLSQNDLAKKYNKGCGTINHMARKGNWLALRNEYHIKAQMECERRAIELRVGQINEFNSSDLDLAREIKKQSMELLESTKINAGDLNKLASTVRNAQYIGRVALGIAVEKFAFNATNGGDRTLEDFSGDVSGKTDEELYAMMMDAKKRLEK